MLKDYIRQIHAAKNFKIKDAFEFISFDDMTPDIIDNGPAPDQIEIFASVKVNFEGKVPDNYRVLNFIIGDWVEAHEKDLTKVIHENLRNHFESGYPGSDASNINADSDSSIWEDQLDFMPRINETENSMIIEIELVIESEIMD